MRSRNWVNRPTWWALVAALGCVPGCPDEPKDDKRNNEVAGFFRADEPWLVLWDNSAIGGHGGTLEFAARLDDTGSPICFGRVSAGDIIYAEQRLCLTATFNDTVTDRPCSVEIEAVATQCARESGVEPAESCELTDETGEVVVDAERFAVGDVQVQRSPACDSVPSSLDSADFWNIINVHPIATGFFFDRAAVGPLVELSGSRGQPTEGLVITGVNDEGAIVCASSMVDGPVEFDGEALSLDVTLNDQYNNASCSVVFEGQRVYCAIQGAGSLYVLRFAGTGRWTRDGEEGSVDALFVSLPRDQQ